MADIDSNGDKELAQSPQSDINSSLRQRKKKSKTISYRINNDTNEQDNKLSSAQEHVFLNMYIRKSQRRIHGKRSNKTLIGEFIFVVILVIIITILGWDTTEEGDWQKADTVGVVVLLLWVIFALCIFFVWGKGPYAKMLRYMVVYLPLIYGVTTQSFYEEVRHNADPPTIWAMVIVLIVLEVLVFVGFMSYYTFMPKILHSEWIRKNGRVQWLWSIESIEGDAWTMKYRAHNPIRRGLFKCKMNYMCQYKGNIDSETGLPNGMGRWIDDAYDGEMLTGYFQQGHPVAPFSSWTVGRSEDAVTAVRIGYFKATDDIFSKNKLVPTNDNLPECGVASVECSISGNFYKHLPSATLIEGPFVVESIPTAHTNPVRNMLSHLFQLCEEDKCTGNQLDIRTDARGVYIPGYVYQPTGRHHSPDTKSIVVDVEWGQHDATDERRLSAQASARTLQRTLFMPKAASSEPLSKIVECEVDDSVDDEGSHEEMSGGVITSSQINNDTQRTATLSIQNWIPIKHKEALVFFPGYNCSTENALKNLGQFLSMTKLSGSVYPVIYNWPGSKNVGYFYATEKATSEINEQNILKMIVGLKESGINRINFLTHSMGVKNLMHVFRDKYDEEGNFISRSEVSKLFTLDPDFDDSTGPKEGKRQQFQNQLICKTITLLNPDFPVKAFVDRGFLSIRRICSTITVVGDTNDRALWWGSLMNVRPYYFDYIEPEVLRPSLKPDFERKRELMIEVGRNIQDQYFPEEIKQQYKDSGRENDFERQLFNKSDSGRLWLDIDCIDMTGLDTNIKGMRHSGFSYNGMLLKDLQELFATGKRARKRSSLIYRDGNTYTFAFAPSFVVQ